MAFSAAFCSGGEGSTDDGNEKLLLIGSMEDQSKSSQSTLLSLSYATNKKTTPEFSQIQCVKTRLRHRRIKTRPEFLIYRQAIMIDWNRLVIFEGSCRRQNKIGAATKSSPPQNKQEIIKNNPGASSWCWVTQSLAEHLCLFNQCRLSKPLAGKNEKGFGRPHHRSFLFNLDNNQVIFEERENDAGHAGFWPPPIPLSDESSFGLMSQRAWWHDNLLALLKTDKAIFLTTTVGASSAPTVRRLGKGTTGKCFAFHHLPTDGKKTVRKWRVCPDLLTARIGHSMAAVTGENFVYVIGGMDRNSSATALDTVERLDVSNDEKEIPSLCWTFAPSMNTRRYGCASLGYKGQIWVTGGSDTAHSLVGLRSTETYDPHKRRWTVGPTLAVPRMNHQMIEFNGHLFVIGGKPANVCTSSTPMSTFERYDEETRSWLSLDSTVFPFGNVHGLISIVKKTPESEQ